MNKKKVSKFSLSYYSLITQIIIINFLTATIGLIIVGLFNLFLFNNNKYIENKINQINFQINDIKNYLEKNAIFKTPQFNEKSGALIFSSTPHLDPYASQLYIENKYLNQPNQIKIYDVNLIKYVDTKDLYLEKNVIEFDINESYQKPNFFSKYRKIYLNFFNNLQHYFNKRKMKEITELKKDDIHLINDTIQKRKSISKIFTHENYTLSINILNPLIQSNNVYGVVLIRGFLNQENDDTALISFNLFNFFLIIIFFMFLLSIIFTKNVIRPIKILSSLVKFEQDKFNLPPNDLNYPLRNDEIGLLE